MHPALARCHPDERPLEGETATAWWERIRQHPHAPHGPELLTPATMTAYQHTQYQLRLRAGMHCWDALTAIQALPADGQT